MYSYTVTGINRLHPPDPSQPQLLLRCKCHRNLIQEQIYTCISCTTYCCHYCTLPDIIFFQCRNCSSVSESNKSNKCKMCFSCPYCSNVLTISRAQDRKFMMWCQYCYWTTKEVDIVAEKSQDLIEALNKNSSSLKGNEEKIYNSTQGLFKEISTIIDYENQTSRYTSGSRRPYKKNQEDSLMDTKNQIEKACQVLIKRVGLDDPSQQFDGEVKLPQNLTLQAKKTRRCPTCKKPLTTAFKSSRTGQQKTQLMYKQLKMMQCQIKPPVDNKVKIKCLRDMIITIKPNPNPSTLTTAITNTGTNMIENISTNIGSGIQCKQGDIREIPINELFKVKIQVVNKGKEISSDVEYDCIVVVS